MPKQAKSIIDQTKTINQQRIEYLYISGQHSLVERAYETLLRYELTHEHAKQKQLLQSYLKSLNKTNSTKKIFQLYKYLAQNFPSKDHLIEYMRLLSKQKQHKKVKQLFFQQYQASKQNKQQLPSGSARLDEQLLQIFIHSCFQNDHPLDAEQIVNGLDFQRCTILKKNGQFFDELQWICYQIGNYHKQVDLLHMMLDQNTKQKSNDDYEFYRPKLVGLYYQLGKYWECIELVNQIFVKNNKQENSAYFFKSLSYMKLGIKKQSLQNMNKMLQMSPQKLIIQFWWLVYYIYYIISEQQIDPEIRQKIQKLTQQLNKLTINSTNYKQTEFQIFFKSFQQLKQIIRYFNIISFYFQNAQHPSTSIQIQTSTQTQKQEQKLNNKTLQRMKQMAKWLLFYIIQGEKRKQMIMSELKEIQKQLVQSN